MKNTRGKALLFVLFALLLLSSCNNRRPSYTGVVVGKRYIPVMMTPIYNGRVTTYHIRPSRWVLIVKDSVETLHNVNVEKVFYDSKVVGDTIFVKH